MSSRAWTEVATGAEARSFRRWLRRAVAPILVRYWILFVGVVMALVIFGAIAPPVEIVF
jgi:hypothetical protein